MEIDASAATWISFFHAMSKRWDVTIYNKIALNRT